MRPEALRLAFGAVAANVDARNAAALKPDAVERFVIHEKFSPRRVMQRSASRPSAARMASGTSPSVSKQQALMHGPMAAPIFSGSQPNSRVMASTAFAAMPSAVPRQPA